VLKNSVLKPTVIADSFRPVGREIESMMGPRQVDRLDRVVVNEPPSISAEP
jgi:hypothetical protein